MKSTVVKTENVLTDRTRILSSKIYKSTALTIQIADLCNCLHDYVL